MTDTGISLIAAEQERVRRDEGFDAEHDKGHAEELAAAAMVYAEDVRFMLHYEQPSLPNGNPWIEDDHMGMTNRGWPWSDEFYKPGEDPLRLLVKTGQLIASAIDALIAEQREGRGESAPE